MKYEFCLQEHGEHHELTMKAKEKHEQAYTSVLHAQNQQETDTILEKLLFSIISWNLLVCNL